MYFQLKTNINTIPTIFEILYHTQDNVTLTEPYTMRLHNHSHQIINHYSNNPSFPPQPEPRTYFLNPPVPANRPQKIFKRELFQAAECFLFHHIIPLGTERGNILHTKLELGCLNLNAHRYSIQKPSNPFCACSNVPETTNHFIYYCHLHEHCRNNILRTVSIICTYIHIAHIRHTDRHSPTRHTSQQTCNWFQWNRLRIRNRLRFVWIQNRNRLRSTIFPLESESDSTPLVLEQNRSRMKKSEMAWSRLRIRNQTFEASLESESDSTPLGTWLSGIGVGINYCWVEVESESTPADRNQLQVCISALVTGVRWLDHLKKKKLIQND